MGRWHSVPDLGHGRLPLDCPSRITTGAKALSAQKRWVVERTFGWLMGSRRLVRDYELPHKPETFIYLAMIRLMVKRLANPSHLFKRPLRDAVFPWLRFPQLPKAQSSWLGADMTNRAGNQAGECARVGVIGCS